MAGRPVMAHGSYQGNPAVIMPYRKPRDGSHLPDWQEHLNTGHRKIRARVEHTLAQMKCRKILRDYRRAASTLNDTVSGIAHLHLARHRTSSGRTDQGVSFAPRAIGERGPRAQLIGPAPFVSSVSPACCR